MPMRLRTDSQFELKRKVGTVRFFFTSQATEYRRRFASCSKYFVAKVSGATVVYPFDNTLDTISINSTADHEFLRMLAESNFTGREWSIRTDAKHAKSKTYTIAH